MSVEQIRSAARSRAAGVRARTDRPRQRRTEPAGNDTSVTVATTFRAQDGSDGIHFTGLASAYERGYEMWDAFGEYTEIVNAGAGARSLARPDLDVTLNLGHDQMRRIAATRNGSLNLSETARGLEVDAPNLDPEDPDVQYIVPKLRSGLFNEMSFAFRITRGAWNSDFTEYRIQEYDLHRGDVAIVGYGASPHTQANLRKSGMDLISLADTRLVELR